MTWARLDGPHLDPTAAAAALRGRPHRFLLHSGSDADGVGRWSFVGFAEEALRARLVGGRLAADPFAALEAAVPRREADPAGPVPLAVGWLGYDLGRTIERLAVRDAEADDPDDLCFALPRAVWRHDGRSGRGEVVGLDAAACRELHAALSSGIEAGVPPRLGAIVAPPAEAHLAAIRRVLDYLRAGDVFQVNLARRLVAPVLEAGDPLALYTALDARAPAPFGALIETPQAAVLSGSPELFLRRAAGSDRVETRPIKGTRARGADHAMDVALAAALAEDPKERAEHLMIVDLLRNDLGRVARTGSVTVDDFARVVSLPTVHHLVSTISCRTSVSTASLLRAVFPGGSITGAPKVRAMQIIDELEPARRGVYTGAIGYLGAGGEIDLAIVIRSGVLTPTRLSVHVGGGIVIDSTPERELEETEEKARAWRDTLHLENRSDPAQVRR